ncbi:hypothetical protein WCLP8_1030002 [uncultured Gammaproteobacteria bacterium]
MNQPTNSDIKAILGKLVDRIEAEATENARFRAGVEAELAANAKFRVEVREELRVIHSRIDCVDIHLTGIDKRQDDQNQILAAMIPVKIAAVGGR